MLQCVNYSKTYCSTRSNALHAMMNGSCKDFIGMNIRQGRRRGFGSGTTEGRRGRRPFWRGVRGRAPGKFCKKDTKSCVLGTSGTLHTHFWRSVHAVESSTVDSVRLQMHNRSTSLEKGQSLMRICIDGS